MTIGEWRFFVHDLIRTRRALPVDAKILQIYTATDET